MTTELVLTLDFHLDDWDSPGGTLWACIQPHVSPAGLLDWVRGSTAGSNFTYRLADPADSNNLVPVNFPDDVNLALEIDGAPAIKPAANRRRSAFSIIDTEPARRKVADYNRQPQVAAQASSGAAAVAEIHGGPFAVGYNRSVREAWAQGSTAADPRDRLDKNRLQQILKLAFWGGTRRYVPLDAVANTGDVSAMRLDGSDATLLVTNLHGLCGLMIRIATKQELAAAPRITDVRLILGTADPVTSMWPVARTAQASTAIAAYFSTLPAAAPVGTSTQWDGEVAARVYALENQTPFTLQPARGTGNWYRREVDRDQGASPRTLDLATVFVVGFDRDRPTVELFPRTAAWQTLQWELYDSFAVTLRTYRKFTPTGANAVLQLTPVPADSERFHAEAAELPGVFASPAEIVLLDPDGHDQTAAFNFIGSYHFPWDSSPDDLPVILLHGPAQAAGLWTVLRRRPVALTTTMVQANDPWGDRWELTLPAGSPAIHFTDLRCINLPDPVFASRIRPGFAFRNDLSFQFAQSASNIEGGITVRMPHPEAVAAPAAVNAGEEAKHDLVNHNALNVYARWGGVPLDPGAPVRPGRRADHLNPYGEIYPLDSQRVGTEVELSFLFRHPVATTAPMALAGQPLPDTRAFFSDLYGRIGARRSIEFDLEHTYGTVIHPPLPGGGTAVGGLSSHFDFPIVVPPDVSRAATPTTASCPATAMTELLSATYVHVPNGPEKVEFRFNSAWLRQVYASCGSGEMHNTHVAAWRAVSEMATASEVVVHGLFRRFDYTQALAVTGAGTIAAGLTPVKELEERSWPVPAAFLANCRDLLGGSAIPELIPFEIILTQPGDPVRAFADCNVVQFSITVTRRPSALPDPAAAWNLVRPRRADPKQNLDSAADTRPIFQSWAVLLARKSAAVTPGFATDDQRLEAERFRRLLGNAHVFTADGRRDDDPGAWILPDDYAGSYSGSAVPSICTATFRAPGLHPLLGAFTFDLLRRYFRALQLVIDCSFAGAGALSLAQWRTHFTLLQSKLAHLDPEDEHTPLGAALALLIPLPDPQDPSLDAEVLDVVRQLRTAGSSLARAFRGWLVGRLWSEPVIFADTKAFLLHSLRGASATGLPRDFFQIETSKASGEPGAPGASSNDLTPLTYRESLATATPQATLAIAEVLDDLRYDNEFEVRDYRLRSFEGVVSVPDKPVPLTARLNVPIAGNILHTPAGPQSLAPVKPLRIGLASRAPLVAPVHVFSGELEELQTAGAPARLRNRRFDLQALRQGALQEAAGPAEAVMLIGGAGDPRPVALDEYVLTSIYAIRGDEESDQDWHSAFENDTFLLQHLAASSSVSAFDVKSPSPEVADLLAKFSATQLPSIAGLPSLVLGSEALSFITDVLQRRAEEIPLTPAEASVTIIPTAGGSPTGRCLDLVLTGDPKRVQALLFASAPAGASLCDGKVPRSTFLLAVSVVARVWSLGAVGLTQSRNVGRSFAPELGQLTRVVAPDALHQPLLVRDGADLGVLPRASYSLHDLLGRLQLVDASESAPLWKASDLSVTIAHHQRRAFPSAHPGVEELLPAPPSAFPLDNPRFTAPVADAAAIHFDPAYTEYLLDFQWSSHSNLQFFRLSGCKLTLT